jgi:hypothetical protein
LTADRRHASTLMARSARATVPLCTNKDPR